MKILAIHSHPDDLEILAGGTLALLRRLSVPVVMASMTPGDLGSTDRFGDEISGIRRNEARASAALIGATYQCVEFRDMEIFPDDPSRRRVVEFLRAVQPELIITSAPVDYLCDHEATHTLVRDACFAASIPGYRTGHKNGSPAAPLAAVPHLYLTDPIGGVDREGRAAERDFFVCVDEAIETKRTMLACHQSQRDWLRAQHGMDDYLDQMQRWTQQTGKAAGAALAEGFRQYRGHPFPETPVLQQMLAAWLRYA